MNPASARQIALVSPLTPAPITNASSLGCSPRKPAERRPRYRRADSSAGRMPSVLAHNSAAATASSSVAVWYSARPDSARQACSGPTPGSRARRKRSARLGDLAVLVLQEGRQGAVQHAGAAVRHRRPAVLACAGLGDQRGLADPLGQQPLARAGVTSMPVPSTRAAGRSSPSAGHTSAYPASNTAPASASAFSGPDGYQEDGRPGPPANSQLAGVWRAEEPRRHESRQSDLT